MFDLLLVCNMPAAFFGLDIKIYKKVSLIDASGSGFGRCD